MDADLLRAARAFLCDDWQIFKTLAIPGSVPFILTGVRRASLWADWRRGR